MGNYRTKMNQLVFFVNGGKCGTHTTNSDLPNKDIRTPRNGEIHFLPEYPEGMDDHILKGAFQVWVNEMKKPKPNGSLVKKEMYMTFAFRRKETVKDKPAISQMVYRWPALFTERQVCINCFNIDSK